MTAAKRERRYRSEYARAWRNGLTVAQLREFIRIHGARCDICMKPWDDTKRGGGLVLDHDHTCCGSQDPQIPAADRPARLCGGCLRGLLCVACNAALGQLADSPERFRNAIAYLARVPERMPEVSRGHPAGEAHWASRLTAEDVRAIRTLRSGGSTLTSIAKQYGVSVSTVRDIARGKIWRHLD